MGKIEQAFELAKERYAELGVDVEAAMKKVSQIEISLHCWKETTSAVLKTRPV